MGLLTQNSHIKRSGKQDGYVIFNFGIPAFHSRETGQITCPNAGECRQWCYASKGAYIWPQVYQAFERRLAATLKDDFVAVMGEAIGKKLKSAERRGLKLAIRVHDSGDYYSRAYLEKWIEVFSAFPNVVFYSFTKQIGMMNSYQRAGKLPENFVVVFSYGSKTDRRILSTDRRASVFQDVKELYAAGAINITNDDAMVFLSAPGEHLGMIRH